MNRITKVFLWVGVACGIVALAEIFLPWSLIEPQLLWGGMKQSVSDPQVQYWFRMAMGAWVILGLIFLAAALRPEKYAGLAPLLGLGLLFEGCVLLVQGLALGLPWFPFCCDVAFCLVVGVGLLVGRRKR